MESLQTALLGLQLLLRAACRLSILIPGRTGGLRFDCCMECHTNVVVEREGSKITVEEYKCLPDARRERRGVDGIDDAKGTEPRN
jgi:hypothetical protein